MRSFFIWLLISGMSTVAAADTIDISLANREFSPLVTTAGAGDALRICNHDTVFHRLFSKSQHNKFGEPAGVQLKLGECTTVAVQNPTDDELRFVIMDEIHAYEKLVVWVRPRSWVCDPSMFVKVWGTWQSDFGPVVLSGTCKNVKGSWEHSANNFGQIPAGFFDSRTNVLILHYYQPWNEVSDGRAMLMLRDQDNLTGTWTDTSGERSGQWRMWRNRTGAGGIGVDLSGTWRVKNGEAGNLGMTLQRAGSGRWEGKLFDKDGDGATVVVELVDTDGRIKIGITWLSKPDWIAPVERTKGRFYGSSIQIDYFGGVQLYKQ